MVDQRLTFSRFTTTINVLVSIIRDTAEEPDELFAGSLSLISTDADVLISPDQAFINITESGMLASMC